MRPGALWQFDFYAPSIYKCSYLLTIIDEDLADRADDETPNDER